MRFTFALLKLLRSEINQLDTLYRLEEDFRIATPAKRAEMKSKIDLVVDEIACSNKQISDLKASYAQGLEI